MPARRSSEPRGDRSERLQERRERQAQVRQQLDAEQRRRRLAIAGAVVVALLAVGGVIALIISRQAPAVGRNIGGSAAGQHVPDGTPISYQSYPPVAGPHYAAPAAWGISAAPLDEGRFVHNLEHGGIAILYKCPTDPSACATLRQQLQDAYKGLPADSQFHEVKAVLSPYDRMDHEIDVLAWGWIDELDQFDTAEIGRFYQAHVDRGPEAVP